MLEQKKKSGKLKIYFISFICLIILIPPIWLLITHLESENPSITLDPVPQYIGTSQTFSLSAQDLKSGIRKIWVALLKDGKETLILEKEFPSLGFLRNGTTNMTSFSFEIVPRKLGISDGKAILRLAIRDFSWRNRFKGNKLYEEIELYIDTKPPKIDILTRQHNVNQGGAGLVIYKIPNENVSSGVTVGKNFFPGFSGHFKDKEIYLAFFALEHDQPVQTEVFVTANDKAGNTAKAGFHYLLKRKKFRKDTLNISDNFLNWKMPEFDVDHIENLPDTASNKDKFLVVNRKMRQANMRTLHTVSDTSEKTIYWEGAFLRLPSSANRARFADHRQYIHNGKKIDDQYHMGIDLASVAQSQVPAANRGRIVMKANIGIFGNTIIIDHGFGLFSMYSHLTSMDVEKQQIVSKGDIIGRTGNTGLAGGDHLHYGMFIHTSFINPLEWWDAMWIKHNITDKIDRVKNM